MTQGQLAKMERQEREIILLNKISKTQEETIKIYQDTIIPMYVKRILKLEEELKDCLIQGGVYND
jgi:hypothetical protein